MPSSGNDNPDGGAQRTNRASEFWLINGQEQSGKAPSRGNRVCKDPRARESVMCWGRCSNLIFETWCEESVVTDKAGKRSWQEQITQG